MGEIPVLVLSREAGEDLREHQFGAVSLNSEGKVVKSGAGVKMFGILQNDVREGGAAAVMVLGVSRAKLSSAAEPGQELATDDAGFLKVDGAAGAQSGATAIDKASAGVTTGVLLK